MAPTVSVNLCCYNSEPFLEETLHSIFRQTFVDWELVVVDDGSIDGTGRIVETHRKEGRPITYEWRPNAGLAAARNRALELSHGQYVAFIDHDDLWLPEKLERQLAVFAARSNLGLVYCDYEIVDGAGKRLGRGSDSHDLPRGMVFRDLLACNFVGVLTAVAPRHVIEAAGGFRPLKITEDYDMWLRIAARHEIDRVPEPLASYRYYPGQSSRQYATALQELLDIYDSWQDFEPTPAYARLVQRARARAFFDATTAALFWDRDPAAARRYACLAWTYGFNRRKVAKMYLLASLRPAVVFKLQHLKHRLAGTG
ncbi:MAG TPA: glycosyltransferase [Chloroflexota bacterium]|nr:glycosyltransferase [Chloroflexota bacterium]